MGVVQVSIFTIVKLSIIIVNSLHAGRTVSMQGGQVIVKPHYYLARNLHDNHELPQI